MGSRGKGTVQTAHIPVGDGGSEFYGVCTSGNTQRIYNTLAHLELKKKLYLTCKMILGLENNYIFHFKNIQLLQN